MDVITQNYPDALPVALSDPTVAMLHTPPQKGVGQGKGYLYHTFFLVLDPTTLIQIQVIAPKKVDAVAALAGLVEGALPAIASLGSLRPPEPTPTPSPEPVGDIATLFPTEIGGKPVEVEPEENRLVGQPVRAVRKLVGLLKKQDRTLDGFRFAIGSPGGTGAIILVVQLPGGRMAPLEGALRDALGIGGDGRSTTIAGKGVRVVEPYHTYVKGDALWVVTANGAELEEIFQKLP